MSISICNRHFRCDIILVIFFTNRVYKYYKPLNVLIFLLISLIITNLYLLSFVYDYGKDDACVKRALPTLFSTAQVFEDDDLLQKDRAVILMRIMRSLDRLSGSDQDCGDREMYIDLDDASVDSLTGKRTRHHVAEVSHLFSFRCAFPFFIYSAATRYLTRGF